MAQTLCISLPLEFPVSLYQTGLGRFRVDYGAQSHDNLNYSEATARLGEAIMHAASCAGAVDNRSRVEARDAGDTAPYFPGEPIELQRKPAPDASAD